MRRRQIERAGSSATTARGGPSCYEDSAVRSGDADRDGARVNDDAVLVPRVRDRRSRALFDAIDGYCPPLRETLRCVLLKELDRPRDLVLDALTTGMP